MEALEALQRAINLGGSDGAVGAWLLYNLLAHYDSAAAHTAASAAQRHAARRVAEFLREADFEGANGEPPSLCVAVSAATASMSAVVSATVASARSPTAVLLLHEPRRVLTPLAARYLYGRALLICGGWSESARELRAVLEQSRALAPLLAFVRVSETALLRQLALAMLCDGQAHALLDLLHIYGMRSSAELAGSRLISPISADLADLVADALLCEFEPAQALSALETALETALVTTGFDTSHAPAVANASAAAHAPSALPPNASAATDSASRRTELRRRNNRACLLTCSDRFGEAEEELLQCVRLAPTELAPNYNLALLRWQVGEKDAAADGWLRFRRQPLEAPPNFYEELATRWQPTGMPPPPASQVSGHVDPLSAATLDRAMLRHWAAFRSRKAMELHWGRAKDGPWL